MLTTNITLAEKYDYLSDKFKKAFTFLRETDLASLPIGRTEIDGDESLCKCAELYNYECRRRCI